MSTTLDAAAADARMTARECAAHRVAEYRWIVAHCGPATACQRLQVRPRAMIRAFLLTGEPVPTDLKRLARKKTTA